MSTYIGKHRRPHDEISPLLKRHLAAQDALDQERRRGAALAARLEMIDFARYVGER
jgi:hypothetical protein